MAIPYEPRHNTVAFLDDSHRNAVPFQPMLAFLRRSRVFHAITDSTTIYKNIVGPFWRNAAVVTIENVTRIESRVLDTDVVVTEQGIRELLQLVDQPNDPVMFDRQFIHGAMHRMGYPGVPDDQYRKALLTRVWRFLMHVFIVCLGNRKAGTDGMSMRLASGMLALVYNKPYNYSGFIFKGMTDNVSAGIHKWAMYPRFIQLYIDRHYPALTQQGDIDNVLKLTPMMNRIFAVCSSYEKGVQAPPDTPLFGAILDAAYVPPPNPQYMDAVAQPEQPLVDAPVRDLALIEQPQQARDEAGGETTASSSSEDDQNIWKDGGETPSDSSGSVPHPSQMERLRNHNPMRYLRIQRRIREGRRHVPKDKGKRVRDDDPTDEDYQPLLRRARRSQGPVIQPTPAHEIQPSPAFLQKMVEEMRQMQRLLKEQSEKNDAQASIIQVQSSQLAEQTKQLEDLRVRVNVLEARSSASGEIGSGEPNVEALGPESVTETPVLESNINENIARLDYFAVDDIPGQPRPLAVDYTYADLSFIQRMVNEAAEPGYVFDMDDEVSVEDEGLEDDEIYDDAPFIETDSSEDEGPAKESHGESSTSHAAPAQQTASASAVPQTEEVLAEKESAEERRKSWFPKGKSKEPSPVRCQTYKVRGDYTGIIKSWKVQNRVLMIKRLDGIQYFKLRFKKLSTLPKGEINRLAQLNLINRSSDSYADFFEKCLRQEVRTKRYNKLKPTLGTKYTLKKKLDPVTRQPIVKLHYPPADCLTEIPLEKVPYNFLRRFVKWELDPHTGEAVIHFVPDSEPDLEHGGIWNLRQATFRIFDPMSLINLHQKDLRKLFDDRIRVNANNELNKKLADIYYNVVKVCIANGIHADGNFPAGWV